MKRAWSRKNIWERTPAGFKKMVGSITRLFPRSFLFGRRFRQVLRFLQATERQSEEWFRDYQLSQLKKVCQLAWEKSPYYREAFRVVNFDPRDLKTLDDFAKLPTLQKKTVMAQGKRMCTISPHSVHVDYVSTGGTSGMPLHFYMGSNRSSVEYAYLVISWQRIGYKPGVPLAIFRGKVVQKNAQGVYHEYDPIMNHHYYSNFHMTDMNMKIYLDHVQTLGPCFLHVYPSSIAALARFILRTQSSAPKNILGIIAESEIVYPEQRILVEEVFGRRYFSCYGHTEKLVLGSECEYSHHYHIWPTYGYYELLDEHGRQVRTPGQTGQIVGTGFINTVMPFIRYETGDYATYVADRCSACGRNHPLITDIRGHRVQEVLIAGDGAEISWTAMNMHDNTFHHVRQFQFYQDKPGKAVLRIVPTEGFKHEDYQRVLTNLGKKFDGRLDFTIELHNAIPLSPRGKAIYVDQHIPQ